MNQFILTGRIVTKNIEKHKYFIYVKNEGSLFEVEVSKTIFENLTPLDFVGVKGKLVISNNQISIKVDRVSTLKKAGYNEKAEEVTF